MTQTQVRLQLRPAQIEIAILQTQVFAGERVGARSVELKRQRARVVENSNLASRELRRRRWRVSDCAALSSRSTTSPVTAITYSPRTSFAFACAAGRIFLIEDNLVMPSRSRRSMNVSSTEIAPPRAPSPSGSRACRHLLCARRRRNACVARFPKVFDHLVMRFGLSVRLWSLLRYCDWTTPTKPVTAHIRTAPFRHPHLSPAR